MNVLLELDLLVLPLEKKKSRQLLSFYKYDIIKKNIFICFIAETVSVLNYFNVMPDLVYYQQK